MFSRTEVPFPPRHNQERTSRVEPPWVAVTPRWEYKDLIRTLPDEAPLTKAELDALGSESWELAAVVQQGQQLHFYFKRERTR